tara:strand:- start:2697 stop:2990 length:294 start_codon:yes stop_codon:yes gene_type:complete
MSTKHETKTLTTAGVAYEIIAAIGGNGTDVTIQNNDAFEDVFIGGAGVLTTDFGFQIRAGTAISFELDGKDSIWAVAGVSGIAVNIMSIGLEGTRIV